MPRGLQDAYRSICSALVRAMRGLGVDAELTGGEVNLQLPGPRSTVPCFEAPAGGEVVVDGRKLIGSAMRAHAGTILQHGAIVLDWDGRLQAGSMGLADDSGLRPHITTLVEELYEPVELSNLKRAVVDACAEELGLSFESGSLASEEEARERKLATSFVVNV